MKIVEHFESIQGEGNFAGCPCLFIRLSGCTRECAFCDTKYHNEGKVVLVEDVIAIVNAYRGTLVCWTGGEPLMQFDEIKEVMKATQKYNLLETNGDLLDLQVALFFNAIAVSPKDISSAKKARKIFDEISSFQIPLDFSIKVVTDLVTNLDLVPFATMLMPLTTFNEDEDRLIRQRVWNHCVHCFLRYSPRLHYEIWGKERGR